jgi:biopolymer transport protein ExbD
MRPKILALLGLSFFVAATASFALAARWLDSRIFVPLRQRVSLDSTHLQSAAFQINLAGNYAVSLELDFSFDDLYEDRPCNYKAIGKPRWRLYRLDSANTAARALTANSEQVNVSFYGSEGSFDVAPGRYQIEWDNSAAAPCLNFRHPRLVIWTSSYEQSWDVERIEIFCLLLGGTGLALIVTAYRRVPRFARPPAPRIFPDMALRQVLPFKRYERLRLISEPLNFGLVWGSLLMVLMFAYMVEDRWPSYGQFVNWGTPRASVVGKSPWPETLVIYVRSPANFLLNGEEVPRAQLRSKLMEQLGKRIVWMVYVEADIDTNFGDTLHAIDVIHSCGAKVIWITPKMRKEWQDAAMPFATH